MRVFLYGLLFLAILLIILLVGGALITAQPVFTSAGKDSGQTQPQELQRIVGFLTNRELHRSFPRTVDLDVTANYIKHEFEQSGARVSEQTFQVDEETYRNVIASFGPENAEQIIVGAHYDAYGSLPGADDNASGTAGLIALAQQLRGADLKRRVDLVAYTLEEPPNFRSPNMGSWQHAESLKKSGVRVKAMLCLEMIGYFSDAKGSQQFPISGLSAIYGDRGNFIVVAANYGNIGLTRRVKKAMIAAGSLPVHSINAPSFLPGIDFSDHLNYWAQDFPAVMITDTAFYRNANYHTTEDTPEKLDFRRMAQVVDGVAAAVKQLANE
jgi:Zn-dependent M28 family amino/carboxypeptidase